MGSAVNNSIDLESMVGQASRLPNRTQQAYGPPALLRFSVVLIDDCGEWWIPSKEEIAAETDYFYHQQELETADLEKQRMLEAEEDPDS